MFNLLTKHVGTKGETYFPTTEFQSAAAFPRRNSSSIFLKKWIRELVLFQQFYFKDNLAKQETSIKEEKLESQ